jgi:hypothetical protein
MIAPVIFAINLALLRRQGSCVRMYGDPLD